MSNILFIIRYLLDEVTKLAPLDIVLSEAYSILGHIPWIDNENNKSIIVCDSCIDSVQNYFFVLPAKLYTCTKCSIPLNFSLLFFLRDNSEFLCDEFIESSKLYLINNISQKYIIFYNILLALNELIIINSNYLSIIKLIQYIGYEIEPNFPWSLVL